MKEVKYNSRTELEGDIRFGDGQKLYEFNKKTGVLQRVLFKKVKDTWLSKLKHKWYGPEKPYPNSYFFSALNDKSAVNKMKNRYNPPFVKFIE